MNEKKLPEALELYRQTANWLVGLAAAALAWLSTLAGAVVEEGNSGTYWLLAAAALMGLAVAFGICLYISLTAYGYAYEAHPKKVEEANAAEAGSDKKKALDILVAKLDSMKEKGPRSYGAFYYLTVFSFFFGFIGLAGLSTVHFAGSKDASSEGKVLLMDGRGQDSTNPGYSVLLLDPSTGLVLELQNDTAAEGTQWDTVHAYTRVVSPLGTELHIRSEQ